jgi:hypothetical protein
MTALSDREQSMIYAAAAPLHASKRQPFIEAVLASLGNSASPVGEGTVNRVIRSLQREFFDPPDTGRHHGAKYNRS